MTRPTSRRHATPDWEALSKLFDSVDTQQSTSELGPAWQRGEIPEPRWAPEYLPSIEQALQQNDPSALLELLDSGRLIHPVLLPALAQVLRAALQGKTGRPVKIIDSQKAALRDLYAQLVGPRKMTAAAFCNYWTEALAVDRSTLERALGLRK
jgi:hypothetical protein